MFSTYTIFVCVAVWNILKKKPKSFQNQTSSTLYEYRVFGASVFFSRLCTAQYLTVETQSMRKNFHFFTITIQKQKKKHKTNKKKRKQIVFCFYISSVLFQFSLVLVSNFDCFRF